jgi:glutamate-1-semialdehyde 2,1-aminomutase
MTTPWRIFWRVGASLDLIQRTRARLLLSRAKHRSLQGHGQLARQLARLLPYYEYDESTFFASDAAPAEVASRRQAGFEWLCRHFRERSPKTLAASARLEQGLSDLAFVNAYRIPFQYRAYLREHLRVGSIVAATDGPRVCDLDGNWSYDLGGSYGVNLFGSAFYKRCIDRAVEEARDVGLHLGGYHPVVADNVERLQRISGQDEVSFHMSGTEAVMQAVRLARYHTGRSHIVRFCGAYHGWWDGVQPGVGNPRPAREVYTLKEIDPATLEVLRTRDDIACVLVNPVQAMHPNAAPPVDSALLTSDRRAAFDKARYARWLAELREVCSRRGIVLVFDEVMAGFRLARGGAQEYFGVKADLVTYGKSLGGGLPVGVVCGRAPLTRRFRDDRPADVCFARGTFNCHPYVMTAMNEFLRHLDLPEVRAGYATLEERWNERAAALNAQLAARQLPVQVANMVSIWTTLYLTPSRYNWMLQYYLRAEGLAPAWIGSGRFLFGHDLSDADFREITVRFVRAVDRMAADGWWWADRTLSNRSIRRRVLGEMVRAGMAAGARDGGRDRRADL